MVAAEEKPAEPAANSGKKKGEVGEAIGHHRS